MTKEPVYLRALDDSDLDRVLHWHNDPDLYASLGGVFRFVSRATEVEWLRKVQTYSSHDINLAICLRDTDEHVGNVYLRDIDWVARRSEVHLLIGEPGHRSRGLGQSALRQIIRHATEDLGLLRLYLFVLESNAAAIRLYEKCEFELEGRLRRHVFKAGRSVDVLVMGRCFGEERVPCAHPA